MPSNEYTISPADAGRTVKEFLYSLSLSTSAVKKLKYGGKILLDGKSVNVKAALEEGSKLELIFPEDDTEKIMPQDIPLTILYEDDFLLAVDKPSGMATHPSAGHRSDTLANAVMHRYSSAFAFRAVTRLDLDTSGIVLLAKDARTCKALCDSIASGGISKSYIALCVGTPEPKKGTINAPIGRVPGSVIKREIRDDGRDSVTEYEVLSEHDGLSVVACRPITGRTHQIRVHMAHIGCPLYGDFLYGTEIEGEIMKLRCVGLEFTHPATGEKVKINAEFGMRNSELKEKCRLRSILN